MNRNRVHYLHVCLLMLQLSSVPVSAWLADTSWLWGCPGSALKGNSECITGVIQVRSVTIYSTVNTDAIVESGADCSQFSLHHQCSRRITNSDTGLSDNYRYFYGWILSKCDGRKKCQAVEIPPWWDLTGETNNPVEFEYENGTKGLANCPQGGTKYTSGVLLHIDCRVGEDVSTRPSLPLTTPRTRPTTPSTTTPVIDWYKQTTPAIEWYRLYVGDNTTHRIENTAIGLRGGGGTLLVVMMMVFILI